MSFIFNQDEPWTYDQVQSKRKIAQSLMSRNQSPRNVGEGLNAIGNALLARGLNKRADAREAELKSDFDARFGEMAPNANPEAMDLHNHPMASRSHKEILKALMGGAPQYRYGTQFHPGGKAVVGEDGPEVVDLPMGAKVQPNPTTFRFNSREDYMRATNDLEGKMLTSPEGPEKQRAIEEFNTLMDEWGAWSEQNDPEILKSGEPGPSFDNRTLLPFDEGAVKPQSSFAGGDYQTADMSGIQPSGTGETSKLNAQARAFQGLMKSLSDYEKLFADTGATMMPGAKGDALGVAHRDLQMQMKEMYNLGVLNGPDLDLMNQILLDPTSVSGNLLGMLGGDRDMEKRVPENINQVRNLMINRATPGLQQMGVDPQSLMPKSNPTDLSDEELLKLLGS